MGLRHLEALVFVGAGGAVIHTALAIATRPVGQSPAAALTGGLNDVLLVAELALLAATAAIRVASVALRASGLASAARQARPAPLDARRSAPAPARHRNGRDDYRRAIEHAVFGQAGPIRGEVPGR